MTLTEEQQQAWDRLAIPDPNNKFQQHRLKNDKVWLTCERMNLAMVDMATSHIRNCIWLLEKNNQTNTKAYRGLTAELEKRS